MKIMKKRITIVGLILLGVILFCSMLFFSTTRKEKRPLAYTGNDNIVSTATADELEETINPSELIAPDTTPDIL